MNTTTLLLIIITVLLLSLAYLNFKLIRAERRINMLGSVMYNAMISLGSMSASQKKLAAILRDIMDLVEVEADTEDLEYSDPCEQLYKDIEENEEKRGRKHG